MIVLEASLYDNRVGVVTIDKEIVSVTEPAKLVALIRYKAGAETTPAVGVPSILHVA